MKNKYKVVDFTELDGVQCPCGVARRGFYEVAEFPGTLHRTDIDRTAQPHFHKEMTEVYYIISCESGAVMQLDDERIELHEEMAVYIPPKTVHRIIGTAKVLIFVLPKFNPDDEYVQKESGTPESR